MFSKKITFMVLLSLTAGTVFAQTEDEFFTPKTTIGGYGELHYNYMDNDNVTPSKTLDFHRFVVFLGHSWSQEWSFKAEVELEHNFVKDGHGELELEQAYVNYAPSTMFNLQAGVILPSAGLLNEHHEPPLFLSVERPDYHKHIIPTTWFGNGAAVTGLIAGFDYKAVVMEGFISDNFSYESAIRGGRQKGFKADAKDLLINTRVDYVNMPGLRAGASFTYNNASGPTTNYPINIIEAHAKYTADGLHLVAEYGMINYSDRDVESSTGYYIDAGYDLFYLLGMKSELIPFFRYSNLSTANGLNLPADNEDNYKRTKWMAGLSYKPIPEVVFKADYSNENRRGPDLTNTYINLGVGYMF